MPDPATAPPDMPPEIFALIRDRSKKDIESLRAWLANASAKLPKDVLHQTLVGAGWEERAVHWFLENQPVSQAETPKAQNQPRKFTLRRPMSVKVIAIMALVTTPFLFLFAFLLLPPSPLFESDLTGLLKDLFRIGICIGSFLFVARGLLVGGLTGKIAYFASSACGIILVLGIGSYLCILLPVLILVPAEKRKNMFAWWPKRLPMLAYCDALNTCRACNGKNLNWNDILCKTCSCDSCGATLEIAP